MFGEMNLICWNNLDGSSNGMCAFRMSVGSKNAEMEYRREIRTVGNAMCGILNNILAGGIVLETSQVICRDVLGIRIILSDGNSNIAEPQSETRKSIAWNEIGCPFQNF